MMLYILFLAWLRSGSNPPYFNQFQSDSGRLFSLVLTFLTYIKIRFTKNLKLVGTYINFYFSEFVEEFSFLLDSSLDGIEVSYNAGKFKVFF